MTRRLAGYDLNGWRDYCTRSWLEQPGEETVEDSEECLFGGICSHVIHTGQDRKHPYVGGIQAGLAQHGKGRGWGNVGLSDRLQIREVLYSPEGHEGALSAAFRALAPAPQLAVMAIPDCHLTTERHQEAWLTAMRASGVRQPFLVWRPVLAVLGAATNHTFSDRDRIGIVTEHGDGFTTQILTLRDTGKLTPERRSMGELHLAESSLAYRYRVAQSELLDAHHIGGDSTYISSCRNIGYAALGEEPPRELVRTNNGDWKVLQGRKIEYEPDPALAQAIKAALAGCDTILFDPRSAAPYAAKMEQVLAETIGQVVYRLAFDTVSKGALEAARRLSSGDPAFYDFLPQVTTLVSSLEGARSHNLVPENEVLPAGRLYRSRTPARFHLMPGQDMISVYLNKELEAAPRRARIHDLGEVSEPTEVMLSLEQQPVAGRARLTLTSSALPTPHIIDFDEAEEQTETWDEIIERHERHRPSIPERLVLQNGLLVWEGISNRSGLSELLERESHSSSPDWNALAGLLSSRPEQRYAISSDGEFPEGLSPEDQENLDLMIEVAEDQILKELAEGTYQANEALKFLSWSFRRCPDRIVSEMLNALTSKSHSFRRPGWATLVPQGLGRTLSHPDEIQQAMDILLKLEISNWKKDQTACMAFLISRTDEAVQLLRRENIDRLAEVVRSGFVRELGGGYTSTFIYLPILLVGMLRWRMIDPWALVTGRDPAADRMAEPLDDIVRDLEKRVQHDPHLIKHLDLLRKSQQELAGEGGHSHLLADLFGLTGGTDH
ncbi:hypothetical protein XMV225_003118 [Aliiroseovarius sp. xm-v-225]|uniref:hypothetical protein n=1 Tax=unclassified Aliiroseovarius TaxID=2623558 RepID=UPI0015689A5B|nr:MULTISPECIES: hypothetical protein [unclassified Aliiroseovarius]NRP45928.1 hypothetical protein [Aliiroseovarius sp. xm-m-378]NRP66796.1 hypothetical protein [Aliiroseovarius sp. xm-v-225]NRP93860.1 hypothetical protein [Aliiroseovarius sp. xm-a-134]